MPKPTTSTTALIQDYCKKITDPRFGLRNPDKGDNQGTLLFEALCWQEMQKLSTAKQKATWTALEEIIGSDDELRKKSGEHIAAESQHFTVLTTVATPRKSIDKEAFLDAAARKGRISRQALEDLWEDCMKESKAPLTKRIVEA